MTASIAPPKNIGSCETINCGRGASYTQLNVRVSKSFRIVGSSRIELIAEGFNLFNTTNPSAFNPRRTVGGTVNATFMQPMSFAGDFQQVEQRVGQIGVKVYFGR